MFNLVGLVGVSRRGDRYSSLSEEVTTVRDDADEQWRQERSVTCVYGVHLCSQRQDRRERQSPADL